MIVYQKYFNVVANSTYKDMENLLAKIYKSRHYITCGYSLHDKKHSKTKEKINETKKKISQSFD